MDTKKCSKCGASKPIGEFYVDRSTRSGLCSICKICVKERDDKYRAMHLDEIREQERERRATHRDEIREMSRKNYAAHPELADKAHKRYISNPEKAEQNHKRYMAHRSARLASSRNRHLMNKYGISFTDYSAMLSGQKGKCAICSGDNGGKLLHVDHDHETGKVRSLLCNECNHGLGNFRDSITLLKKAEAYLMEYATQPGPTPGFLLPRP